MNKDSEKSTLSNKNQSEKKNEGTSSEDDIYFYIMTLQADGERHQIKIFKNSNASELAFNFCKTYNMDFQTMKYLKKCIKKIILNFDNKRKNEMIYLLKDNSSIQEVAEEEIITDNSLKKSGTYRKTNSKNTNNKNENANLQIITNNNIIKNKLETKNIIQKLEDVDKEKNIIKSKNSIETDDKINSKDYSIDYCLENDSIEVFQPTEHTTKIEQRSSIKNSSSINKNKGESKGKKMNSKNKKLQIINNNALNMNRINKNYINCPFILGKNNRKISTNELKHLIHQYTEKIPKEKSQSKSKEKNENLTMRKKNYLQYTKLKYKHNNIKSNKYDKFLTNMNEMKNKYFSNYYDYFIKTKIINNGIKYQNSYSINQDSNRSRSKSISQQKMKKNLTQRINIRNKTKKEKSNISNTLNTISSINHQKINNNISKLNLNTILKKEGNSKEKKRTVFKNQIKTKFSIILNKNHNIFNKTILTSRNKNKNMNGKELFLDNKKKKKVIRKMVTESLLNIHKQKENNKDKRKNMNICLNNKVMRTLNNISKNSKSKEGFLKNDSGINKSINFVDKLYFDSGN